MFRVRHSLVRPCIFQGSQRMAASNRRGTHYHCLGVPVEATETEIKSAYRRKALECHPDVARPELKTWAVTEFRRISEAYSVLMDPKQRPLYDQSIGVEPTATRASPRAASRSPSKSPPSAQQEPKPAARRRASPSRSRPGSPKKGWRATGSGLQFGMLKGQAESIFREAFQGKTIHDIIFDARWEKKYGPRNAKNTGGRRADGLAKSGTDVCGESPDEAMHTLRSDIARAYQTEFRFTDPRLLRVHLIQNAGEPLPPPASHMPFRPFVGSTPPKGVTFEEVPKPMPPLALKRTEDVSVVSRQESWAAEVERQGEVTHVGGKRNLLHQRNVWPVNQGTLCSYQRPV